MKAIVIEHYGGPEQLKLKEVSKPNVGENEVLIEVYAIATNPAEWKMREGYLKDVMPFTFPHILGYDVAGIIREVGRNVSKWKIGDAVLATANGSYAEFTVADENQVVAKPENINFNEAASIISTSMTAWTALFIDGKLTKDQKVLIHGGAGGVGSMAIQLAKHAGAYVASTGSTSNVNFLKELGADVVVDYTNEDFTKVLHDYDLVVDLVGGETQIRSYQVLKKGGTLTSAVGIIEEGKVEGIHTASVWVQPSGELLTKITKLLESGELRAVVKEVLPFEEDKFQRAHEQLQTGHTRGKIVIQVKE
ncbi:NADP-dependent oxidoreductase [Sporosarcina sp. USHLN248]|uniref:NADP-dependent oxidoreductase n=1 Tax=Sporosarcina sp. USHLN248 TaxID=3081300 RepID=UPI00301678AB